MFQYSQFNQKFDGIAYKRLYFDFWLLSNIASKKNRR